MNGKRPSHKYGHYWYTEFLNSNVPVHRQRTLWYETGRGNFPFLIRSFAGEPFEIITEERIRRLKRKRRGKRKREIKNRYARHGMYKCRVLSKRAKTWWLYWPGTDDDRPFERASVTERICAFRWAEANASRVKTGRKTVRRVNCVRVPRTLRDKHGDSFD